MNFERQKVKICEIADINKFNYSTKDKWNFINYLDTGNITENKIDLIQFIDLALDKLPSRAKRKVKDNSIIYSTVRPNQKHFGFIKKQPLNFLVSTGFTVLDCKTNVANPKYVYYYLIQDNIVDYLHSIAEQSVSTYPSIKSSDIGDLEILLPSLEAQEKTAKILSALDDKIELNNRINKNLEKQAQALFKSWFVDFEPFGGVMPSDWCCGQIKDLSAEIICGKTPSTKDKDNFGSDIPFITIPDLYNNVYVIKTERYLSTRGANLQRNKFLPKNSICVSCIGTAGLVSLVYKTSQTNQQINSIIPKDWISPYFIYFTMLNMSNKINSYGQSGSTIVNMNKSQFEKLDIIIPNIEIMKDFNNHVKSHFDLILINQLQNEKIAQLRDALLPKLMNGEIDVDKVEI